MRWTVWDIETTTRASYKRKANPFDPENWIVLSGYCTKADPEPRGAWFEKTRQARFDSHFQELLGKTDMLIGVNIKFDVLHAIERPANYKAWQAYVLRGGTVWDCQLVEYLLNGQDPASHMLSLDDLAIRYDEDTKVDEVKMLWEAGVDTPDIDPDLLWRYAIGEDLPDGTRREGDIGNTRNIFLKQLERVRREGMSKLVILEAGALLASIEMEHNGLVVDKELGLEIAGELREELAKTREELQQYLPKDLPFEFNWGSRHHLSPLLFGGKVRYDRREYDLKGGEHTWEAPDASNRTLYVYAQRDEVQQVLDKDGEPVRYKSGKKAGEIKTKKFKVDDYTKPKSRMTDAYYTFPRTVDPLAEWASSTPGLYSVAAEVIDVLTDNTDIPFLQVLGKVAQLDKDLSTYFINDEGDKGMLLLVDDTGTVHHQLNHTSTVTGRLSSSNPNLQNLPKGDKSRAKELFVSRYEGGYIISSDFKSLETYILANQSHAVELVRALSNGVDMHCLRLAKKEHMEYEIVYELCKGEHPDPAWELKRDGIKTFSYGSQYGAGVAKLAKMSGMPEEEIKELRDNENELFPEVQEMYDDWMVTVQDSAIPTTSFVAHPLNPAISVQLRVGYLETGMGKRYSFRSVPSNQYGLRRGELSDFPCTILQNYPTQGDGAQVMKAAMWILVREFYRTGNFDGQACLINTVHDAAYTDAAPSVAKKVAVTLDACMTLATDYLCWWHDLRWALPVPTDTTWGPSMAIENRPDFEEFDQVQPRVVEALRQRYMGGAQVEYTGIEKE